MKTTRPAMPTVDPPFNLGVGAGTSEASIDLGAVLNPVEPHQLLLVVNPIENPMIADAEFAQTCQVVRHADESAMHHRCGVLREPADLSLHARRDGRIEVSQLTACLGAYLDLVRPERDRGCQGLNLPARSSRRAARNSSTRRGFCAVNQSSSSSSVSTDSKTSTGISTVAGRDFMGGECSLVARNGKQRRRWRNGRLGGTACVTVGDQAAVTVDVEGGMKFYRLKKP